MMGRWVPTAALLALCPLVSAAELVVRDLRLGLRSSSLDFDVDIRGDTVDASDSDAFEGSLALEVGLRRSLSGPGHALGLVIGGDLILERLWYASDGELDTVWARVGAGLGYAVNDRVQLGLEAGLLYGHSMLELPASSAHVGFSADGQALAYDLRLEATWRVSTRLCVGAYVGYQMASHELSGDGLDVDLERNGAIAGLQLLWRFSNAPPRLR